MNAADRWVQITGKPHQPCDYCRPGYTCLPGYSGNHREAVHKRRTPSQLEVLLRWALDRMRALEVAA
jgi:hypothetical protein